jgi:hypothetical protein
LVAGEFFEGQRAFETGGQQLIGKGPLLPADGPDLVGRRAGVDLKGRNGFLGVARLAGGTSPESRETPKQGGWKRERVLRGRLG